MSYICTYYIYARVISKPSFVRLRIFCAVPTPYEGSSPPASFVPLPPCGVTVPQREELVCIDDPLGSEQTAAVAFEGAGEERVDPLPLSLIHI